LTTAALALALAARVARLVAAGVPAVSITRAVAVVARPVAAPREAGVDGAV
jgi:hypothetical protein